MTPVTLDVRRAEARPLRGDGPQYVTARRAPRRLRRSLEGDGGAGALEGRLCLLCRFLVHALQDRLRCAVDQVLCLLEAEAGEGAHLLDDLDLLLAGSLENDVELRLLLLGLNRGRGSARGGGGGDRRSSGELVSGELLRHGGVPSWYALPTGRCRWLTRCEQPSGRLLLCPLLAQGIDRAYGVSR